MILDYSNLVFCLGSNASRNPSPMNTLSSITAKSASEGKSVSHHA
jgi:hypothetical protein